MRGVNLTVDTRNAFLNSPAAAREERSDDKLQGDLRKSL